MKLVAYTVVDGDPDFQGPSGAVLVDSTTGFPLPVPPGSFLHQADAEAFIRWMGGHAPFDALRLRFFARRWARERDKPACPSCPGGRCDPGHDQCETCETDAEFATVGVRAAAEGLTR